MNTIAIMDSLSLELSSELRKNNNGWEKTVFGTYANVTAYISEGSTDVVSIIPKAPIPSTTMAMMINEKNEWVAKPAQYQTKRVTFISKSKKGVTAMSHTCTDYDAGGPVRFCRHCGCTLTEVFDSVEDKIFYVHPKFGVDLLKPQPIMENYESEEEYADAVGEWEDSFYDLSICKSGDKILNGMLMEVADVTCGIANHKEGEVTNVADLFKKLYSGKIRRMSKGIDLLKYLTEEGSIIIDILNDNLDDRDYCQKDENGHRVDKCEYKEPINEGTSEGVSMYNEGTIVSDIQPSKLLTENRARNALEEIFMDYTRGKVTLAVLEARIFTTLRNGNIDLEEADYYRELVGLPTNKDPEPTTPTKKYRRRGVIGHRIIKAPKVKDGVTVTKINVQQARSTNYRWIMEVNANYKDRKYVFVRGDKASHWIIKDQAGKSHLINDYNRSKAIMNMVDVVNNLVQKDWIKMINRI